MYRSEERNVIDAKTYRHDGMLAGVRENRKRVACATLAVVLLGCDILLIVGLKLDIQTVGQNEFGVYIDSFDGSISDVLEQGTHPITLGSTMHTFQRTLQDSGLSLINCLTQDNVLVR
jgi:hypothetical protein